MPVAGGSLSRGGAWASFNGGVSWWSSGPGSGTRGCTPVAGARGHRSVGLGAAPWLTGLVALWRLPSPRLELRGSALAGRFLASGPPGLPFSVAGATLLQCIDGLLLHSASPKVPHRHYTHGVSLAGGLLLQLGSNLMTVPPVCLLGEGKGLLPCNLQGLSPLTRGQPTPPAVEVRGLSPLTAGVGPVCLSGEQQIWFGLGRPG